MFHPLQTTLFPVLVILLLSGLAACSDGVDWSARERENAAHLTASLAATAEAAAIANAISSETTLAARREPLLQTLRSAHLHAVRVDDTVLDKLHPRMYGQFRLRYQRALAAMIRAYENGDLGAAQNAAADVQDFLDWYRRENHTFRWWEEAMPH